jgi:hypothetical protein
MLSQRVLDFIFHFQPLKIARARALVLGVVFSGNSIGMAAMISAGVFSYAFEPGCRLQNVILSCMYQSATSYDILSKSFAAGATFANISQDLFHGPDAPNAGANMSQEIQSYSPPEHQQLTLTFAPNLYTHTHPCVILSSTTFPPAHTLISSPHACIHVTLHSSNFCQAPKLGTYHITRCKSRITQISLSYVEVVVLLTIVAAFIYVGCLCNMHFDEILKNLESIQKVFHALDARVAQVRSEVAAANSRHLRRRYLTTVAAVFVTFVLRSVFSLMLATNATAGVLAWSSLDDDDFNRVAFEPPCSHCCRHTSVWPLHGRLPLNQPLHLHVVRAFRSRVFDHVT